MGCRTTYITTHPLCEDCLEQGRYTPAAEVHHNLPLGHGGAHDPGYLRALCKPCHSRQSALDGDRWRQRPRVYTY
ncbi:HNH endonuclease signature motif containing protein [Gulosibacter bifidus]|uniref:HNH endonuclease signature motif containing protein n=1 Tax=Gulosibacter bifidus TaxID=272239 RepID=A0ABW5RJA2_9MICO|nr:HNH endonuclease signature motif containing protein [Gulosibacter bifidus]